jgi:putative aldouronate transport system substrate-binding protein
MKILSKRLSTLLVTTVVSTSLLAGCSSSSSSSSTAGDSKLSNYVLDWYFIGNGPQPDVAKVEDAADKLLKDINVTLKMHCFDWGTYQQKMSTLLATNDKVDLLMTAGGWGSLYFEDIRKNQLVDITTLAPKYAPNAVKTLKGGFWEYSAVNGKNYGLPVNKEKAAQTGLEFNKKLVDKYKFDITTVKSIDDVEPMLKTIKANEPSVYGIEPQATLASSYLTNNDDQVENGLAILPHDSTDNLFVSPVDNHNLTDIFKTMRKYYLAGYIRKDAATVTDVTPDRKAGKSFILFDSLKPGKDTEVSLANGVQYVQQTFGTPFMGTNDTTGCMMSIPKAAKDPSRVLMFMDKMYTDTKLINLIDYGIEGTHYVKKGDNTIDFPADSDGGKKLGYNPGTPWMFGDQFKSYLYTTENPKKWDLFKAFNESAVAKKDAGFAFDDSNVKNEVAACTNVQKEFEPGLNVGSVDPEAYIPKYKAKLIAAGEEKIIAEVNKQYKTWQAAQKK